MGVSASRGEGTSTSRLPVHRPPPVAAPVAAAWSRSALDRPLSAAAELVVLRLADEALVRGAFDHARAEEAPLARGSGGPPVRVGPGSLWVQLALARPDALVACDAPRLVNRYVRPLLKAVTKSAALAHWFGRDWVSASKRPVAFVGFAHDARTGRALVEAVIAGSTPFATGPRPSFLGHAPATLAELTGRTPDLVSLAEAVSAAYATAYDREATVVSLELPPADDPTLPPVAWSATEEEAIGTVGAGRDASGRLRVGGELMASRDAMESLEAAIASLDGAGRVSDEDAVGAAVDAALGPPATVFGVRALRSVRDVVVRAGR